MGIQELQLADIEPKEFALVTGVDVKEAFIQLKVKKGKERKIFGDSRNLEIAEILG